MSVNNTRPAGSRCWAHDTCEPCGHDLCDDCAVACTCQGVS